MIGDEERQTQPGNIEGRRIIARPIPLACGVDTTQPRGPVIGLAAVEWSGGAIGVSRLVTVGAGMGGATSLHITAADAQQRTLVFEDAPQLATDLRVVAPM